MLCSDRPVFLVATAAPLRLHWKKFHIGQLQFLCMDGRRPLCMELVAGSICSMLRESYFLFIPVFVAWRLLCRIICGG